MAVEEGELLRAVGRVIGGIEIDRDPACAAMQPLLVPLDHARRQLAAHRVEGLTGHAVFEPRDRRLRRERIAGDGVTTQQELLNRIARQPVGVIGIGIAAGEAEDPMGQQVTQRVPHLSGLPIVHEAAREPIDQSVPAFRRVQQDGAAIGARMRLIEGCDEGFVEQVRKADSLWYRVVVQH